MTGSDPDVDDTADEQIPGNDEESSEAQDVEHGWTGLDCGVIIRVDNVDKSDDRNWQSREDIAREPSLGRNSLDLRLELLLIPHQGCQRSQDVGEIAPGRGLDLDR